jgi:hypothetical protein
VHGTGVVLIEKKTRPSYQIFFGKRYYGGIEVCGPALVPSHGLTVIGIECEGCPPPNLYPVIIWSSSGSSRISGINSPSWFNQHYFAFLFCKRSVSFSFRNNYHFTSIYLHCFIFKLNIHLPFKYDEHFIGFSMLM